MNSDISINIVDTNFIPWDEIGSPENFIKYQFVFKTDILNPRIYTDLVDGPIMDNIRGILSEIMTCQLKSWWSYKHLTSEEMIAYQFWQKIFAMKIMCGCSEDVITVKNKLLCSKLQNMEKDNA